MGSISDATFVGLLGRNETFFTKKGNLSGFQNKMTMALQLPDDPAKSPLKTNPKPFETANFSYDVMGTQGNLTGKPITTTTFRCGNQARTREDHLFLRHPLPRGPIQAEFPEIKYGKDFQRALEEASLFGNAVVAIRGHADPSLLDERLSRLSALAAVG